MALSIPRAPRARARAARSMSFDRWTGSTLLTAFVRARTSLLVLTGRASGNAACGGHDAHRVEHRYVEHRYDVGRRLDVVLAGSTDAAPLQQQRMPSVCPLVQQGCPVAQGAVDRRGAPSRQASASVLPQKDSAALRDHVRSLDPALHVEEERLLSVRRAGSAAVTETMSSTLVVAGLIGLLGVCGAAASIVHSVTGPVHRAVRVLQAPEKGRRGHRLRRTTLHQLHDSSRALDTAGDDPLGAAREIGADARSLSMTSEGPTATSGTPSSSAEGLPTPAGVVFIDVGQVPAVPADVRGIALNMTDAGHVVARTVADTGFAVISPGAEAPAEETAKAAEVVTAASTPAASSVATTRYAAARSRALGPTTALWHAVELDRLVGAIGGACETTVCGSLVRVGTEQGWPVPARDVCPACSTLAH